MLSHALLLSAEKLDGIKEMSDPFVDGRVDARVEDWYTDHTPGVEVRTSLLSSEVRIQCHCLNRVFVLSVNSTSICGMESAEKQKRSMKQTIRISYVLLYL